MTFQRPNGTAPFRGPKRPLGGAISLLVQTQSGKHLVSTGFVLILQ
ncbi:MAG: hypothetical protein RLZ45_251 [Verrucomicrobiota bacterium]|jgi:hypothetical protein